MPKIHSAILALTLLLAGAGAASADTTAAWDAYYAGDFAKAEQLARPEAEQGDADAEYLMGLLNSEQDLKSSDPAAAADWYRKAAEQGQVDAQNALGYAYDFGLGVPRDTAQAKLWYGKAAAEGTIIARNNMAYEWAQAGENLDQALGYAKEAVAADPKSAPYVDTLGWVYYKQLRYADALPVLCRAASFWPGAPEIRAHLGDAYWHMGLVENAKEQWQAAIDMAHSPRTLNQESRDFLQAEGAEHFDAEMRSRQQAGPGDGPAPDKAHAPALTPDAIEACNLQTS